MNVASEDVRLLREQVRRFIRERVEPSARWIEEHDAIPEELMAQARALGLFGLTIPEAYGGIGLDLAGKCAIEEEFGRTSYGFAVMLGNHTGISTTGLVLAGTEVQKRHYLPRMASGEWLGSFALTEAEAGSDPGALRTTATRTAGGYVLNGEKIYITNAALAQVFTVMAVTRREDGIRGISAFIVERGTPGFTIGRNELKMGMHGCSTAPLSFRDCFVPEANLLGPEGRGYIQALQTLTAGRVTVAARCVGIMDRLIERCVEHMKLRKQGGRRLAEHQGLQWMLADMAVQRDAARLLVERAIATLMRGERGTLEASVAKLHATEAVGRIADCAVQIHGGMGYMREAGIETVYRDVRITRIYEGTSEIQRNIIAQQLLRDD